MAISLSENKKFWESEASRLLLNPRYRLEEKERLAKAVEEHEGTNRIWLRSSGTESSGEGIKLVALQKSTILHAAESVNRFFALSAKDTWLNCLPIFHIGGLSIYARAFLSESKVIVLESWSCSDFIKRVDENKITLCSLVPTQVFDLVEAKALPPKSLRLVIVGGGALDQKLLESATKLGWPIAVSYGMTETCALIAATRLEDIKSPDANKMEILPHVELHPAAEKWSCESQALFEAYLWVNDESEKFQVRPKPFILDDRLVVKEGELRVLGRESEIIKVLGETVNLNELSQKISPYIKSPFFLHPKHHPRRGFEIELILESDGESTHLEELNQKLMPYEKMSALHKLDKFSYTSLGKINKTETLKRLNL